MTFHVFIPTRYGSTRFPGKALADIAGKPMIVRVCERAAASGAQAVHVATDDDRIGDAVKGAGFSVVPTRTDHVSGTDRIAEAVRRAGLADDALVVNLQGDEPLIDPALVGRVARRLREAQHASMASACHAIADEAEIANPNVVKVVLDAEGYALYFSRSRIPYPREAGSKPAAPTYRHVGLYACRAAFLREFTALPPSPLERAEALEQLRALWHGHRIAMVTSEAAVPPGVDTREDLEAVRRMWR
ncbi:MAG TPA: 3-deoxy-manno-octulosonate cytidylyltransferase [Burkholderiales bacterium]|nr:3-deoxy-manno-octulosonate cytidylyltransferase [Burkholderiales bacterium]